MRISDWSSDVCSSDLAVAIAVHAREVIAGAVDLRVRGERQERRQDKGRQEFHRRIVVVPLALAPPPAKAGGGWEGVPTVRADPKGTPPRPSPAFAGEGARARGFRRSEETTSELQSLMRISYAV